jgi:hypothetical protein
VRGIAEHAQAHGLHAGDDRAARQRMAAMHRRTCRPGRHPRTTATTGATISS